MDKSIVVWSATFLLVLCFHGVSSAIKPVFIADNIVSTIFEQESSKLSLSDLTCTDNETTTIEPIISLTSVAPSGAPCSNCFQVYPNCGGGLGGVPLTTPSPGTASYCLEFLPIGTFDFRRVNTYYITMTCKDDQGEVSTLTLDLRLEPNLPPYFSAQSSATPSPGHGSTLIAVSSTLANTRNVGAGGSIYDASCNDPESDALTYTMTSNPSSSLFTIDANGVIRATGNLAEACYSSVTFTVYCKDPLNTAEGPMFVQITLSGANQRPAITGMNFNRDVPEDTVVGSTLAAFQVADDDSPTCLLYANPTESLQYFSLDSSQRAIIVKTKLDYEQFNTRNTNLTVTCTDSYCTSSTRYLYVRVTEVNEPITLYPQNFLLSTYEGQISLDPKWTPIDPDVNDYATYTIAGGNMNGRFAIEPTTGLIYSTLEYDIDQGAMPTTDFLIVKATDIAGHTSTTTVSLTILDKNDNKPTFGQTQNAQFFTITDCTSTIGTSLGTVSATDRDSTYQGNNLLSYSGSNGPITIGSTGNILVGSGIVAGATYTVLATATDAGQYPSILSSTPPASITVTVTSCPTTTTTTTTTTTATTPTAPTTTTTPLVVTVAANSKNDTEENLAWIIIAALLGTLLVAALGFMLFKFCYPAMCAGGPGRGVCSNFFNDCCNPRPTPRTVKPYRGQPPNPGNKGFWQERYPDDDYKNQPMRDRTPSPAPMEGNGPLAIEPVQSWRPRALEYY